MSETTVSCIEIVRCLCEDHDALREQVLALRSGGSPAQRREELDRFGVALAAHFRAEEEVVLARALEHEDSRVAAMAALERNELADLMLDRLKHSAHEEQLAARLRVLAELLETHVNKMEREVLPGIPARLSLPEREEMGMRYREAKSRVELAPVFQLRSLRNEAGRIGYIIAWLLGVPAWLLLMIFLIRGH